MIHTAALPDAVVCAALWAATVTEAEGTEEGAVYMPDELIVPTEEFPPNAPFTIQLTAVLLVPETEALNCWDWPTCRLTFAGDTITDTGAAGAALMETGAVADAVGCATLCAVTVTADDGTEEGAL